MVHIPGVKNKTSDAISRYPTGNQIPPKMQLLYVNVFHISHFSYHQNLLFPSNFLPAYIMTISNPGSDEMTRKMPYSNQLLHNLKTFKQLIGTEYGLLPAQMQTCHPYCLSLKRVYQTRNSSSHLSLETIINSGSIYTVLME